MSLPAADHPLLWLGVITFLVGALVWHFARTGRLRGPAWLTRLGVGMASLGVATLALTQPGLGWMISSICFSLIAIIYLLSIIVELLRRRS